MIINMIGGGGKVFAVIGVTYPAGSVCTCTNGSKTLTAKDTSGTVMFIIPSVGEWTVTATSADGAMTKSATVNITAAGQIENVVLSYTLYIIQNGKYNRELGFSKALRAANSLVMEETGSGLYLHLSGQQSNARLTDSKVDIRSYSKLTCDLIANVYGEGNNYAGLTETIDASVNESALANLMSIKVKAAAHNDRQTISVDLSSVTGSYYVGFLLVAGSKNPAVTIYNMWLE